MPLKMTTPFPAAFTDYAEMLRLTLVAARQKLRVRDTEFLLTVLEEDEATLAWFRAMGLNEEVGEDDYPELDGFRVAGIALSCISQLVDRVAFPETHPYPQHYGFWQCGGFEQHQWWGCDEPLKNEIHARIVAELLRPSGLTVSKIFQNTQSVSMTEYTRTPQIFAFLREHGYLPQGTDIFAPKEGFVAGGPRVEYVAHYGTVEAFFALHKPKYEAYDAYLLKSY